MQKHIINGIEILTSSDNVFADLGLPDAKLLQIKTRLIAEIMRSMRRLGLNQTQAARRMDISPGELSAWLHGDFDEVFEHQLMECLNKLGCDIEINIQPARQSEGYLRVVSKDSREPMAV